MLLYFTAVSAIVPSILLLWWFRARDLNPEPVKVLMATFLLGVATVVPVLMVALPLALGLEKLALVPVAHGWAEAFITAAGPEEFFKYLVVVLYASRHREFDEPMDGVVYGAVASLGFASLENVLYVSGGGLGVALLRALSAVPMHACTGAIMGYYVGQAKFDPANRGSHLWKGYFIPFLLHGLYDAPVLAMKQAGTAGGEGAANALAPWALLTVAVMVFEVAFTLRITRRLRLEQLRQRALGWAGVPAQAYRQPGFVPPAGLTLPAAMPKPQGAGLGVVLLVVGIVLASGGGLMTLGMLAALAGGTLDPSLDPSSIAIAVVLMGVLPLALGLVSFGFGARRLARANETAVQAMAAPYQRFASSHPGAPGAYAPNPGAQYAGGPSPYPVAPPNAPWQGGPPHHRS